IEEMLPNIKLLDMFCDFLVSSGFQNHNISEKKLQASNLDEISNDAKYIKCFKNNMKLQKDINKYFGSTSTKRA
ncbi:MAG TPA: hypothetical protein VFP93_00740, partial [Gammaproteobacteria bacterium]|nr:hypothetical protein [Gammaproteobacteria bacterium]